MYRPSHSKCDPLMSFTSWLMSCKRQADAVQALKFHGMSLSIWEIGQP